MLPAALQAPGVRAQLSPPPRCCGLARRTGAPADSQHPKLTACSATRHRRRRVSRRACLLQQRNAAPPALLLLAHAAPGARCWRRGCCAERALTVSSCQPRALTCFAHIPVPCPPPPLPRLRRVRAMLVTLSPRHHWHPCVCSPPPAANPSVVLHLQRPPQSSWRREASARLCAALGRPAWRACMRT